MLHGTAGEKKNVGPSSTTSLLHDPGQMLAVLGLHFPICKMGAVTALSGSVWIKQDDGGELPATQLAPQQRCLLRLDLRTAPGHSYSAYVSIWRHF